MSEKSKKMRRKLLRSLKRWLKNPFSYLLILILALIVLATYVVYKTETKTDSGITGLFDAVWHTIVAVVAAYYDFYVKSVPGRFASLVLLLFGMALWTVIIGKITSVIMNIQSKNNRGLKKIRPMKGQFLICGWKNGFERGLLHGSRSIQHRIFGRVRIFWLPYDQAASAKWIPQKNRYLRKKDCLHCSYFHKRISCLTIEREETPIPMLLPNAMCHSEKTTKRKTRFFHVG